MPEDYVIQYCGKSAKEAHEARFVFKLRPMESKLRWTSIAERSGVALTGSEIDAYRQTSDNNESLAREDVVCPLLNS